MRITSLTVALLCVACLQSGRALCGETPYGRYKARRTFVPDKGTPASGEGRKPGVLAADFLTTGLARPDGSDIAVFAGKDARPADFKLMMLGPGDRARIAIRMIPGIDEYHVCYGGPPGPITRTKWEPDTGLILETRKFNGGDPSGPQKMLKLIEASGPSYGTWFVPNIWQGPNLFGPSDNYVSIYRGWLHIPKTGQYRFATTSDDASYFLVDGKIVSSKPSWGSGPADARLALAKGNKSSAFSEALECANANKSGPNADQLLILAATICLQDGRGADAVAIARRIRKDYPESPAQEQATLLECHGLYTDKQYAQAAKLAADAYAKSPAAETAPKLLLLGMSFRLRMLMICYCYREYKGLIRIISARKATKNEREHYAGVGR